MPYDEFAKAMQQAGGSPSPGFFQPASDLSRAYSAQQASADAASRELQGGLFQRRYASDLGRLEWGRKQSAKNRKYQMLAAMLAASQPMIAGIGGANASSPEAEIAEQSGGAMGFSPLDFYRPVGRGV